MIDEEDVINLFKSELYYINENELINSKVKEFYISEKELTIRNGELTSSFTIVRKKVYENYMNIYRKFSK
ncbi:MAG: hypothetical protein KatS3mg068_1832 [Candidatus Sericytochromatia bacterium]|nr:MAG: hypothetical protein KatS3mg068_1832 [Candidatus Sericytochromatia bacterium]